VRFIIDAQLPRKLAEVLGAAGHDAIHTLDLPQKNRTPDSSIADMAFAENRVVITKDTDFLVSHLVKGIPEKLLLVRTGNIRNRVLLDLFREHHRTLEGLFIKADLIELHPDELVVHRS